jgi:PAS domain S-box-containing protein
MTTLRGPQFEALGRHLIEGGTDCVKILDAEGRIVYLNPSGARLLGVCAPDLVNRSWLELWEGEHRDAARSALVRAKSGEQATFEGFCRTADGSPRWWDVVVTPVADDTGTLVQLLAVSRDVTERKKEADFRAGQHDVLEMIATGVALETVLAQLVTLVERRTDGMICSVQLLDEDALHIRHGAAPNLPESYIKAIDGARIGPRVGSCGTAMFEGRQVVVTDVLTDPVWEDYRDLAIQYGFRACWSTPIFSAQNEVLGSFAMYYREAREPVREELQLIQVAADIAKIAIEHQRAQEALRLSEERNRAILRAIPDWMFILSADGEFLDYHVKNPAELLVPPEVFLGKRITEILPPAISEPLSHALKRALEADEPQNFEYSLDAGLAQRFYEVCVVRCDSDKFLSIVRDVSDRKHAEMDIAAQQRQLAHLNRVATLGELSGAIAHELSQPLTAILSNAQAARRLTAKEPVDLPEVRATLDDIIANDKRAGVVIERLRALLKKDNSSFGPLDLNAIAREILDLAHSDLVARRVAVTTRLEPSLQAVQGDRIQLQQVLLNLLLNACEAMSHTPLGERQLLVTTSAEDGFAQISVSDRGLGIPDDQLDAVFEPFVTFRDHGLGLGLAISRSIAIAHGGRITAENNPDGGSTFRCFLPADTE